MPGYAWCDPISQFVGEIASKSAERPIFVSTGWNAESKGYRNKQKRGSSAGHVVKLQGGLDLFKDERFRLLLRFSARCQRANAKLRFRVA